MTRQRAVVTDQCLTQQVAQLSQTDRAMLRVIAYFAKSFKVLVLVG